MNMTSSEMFWGVYYLTSPLPTICQPPKFQSAGNSTPISGSYSDYTGQQNLTFFCPTNFNKYT
jgi:hypothetical protein